MGLAERLPWSYTPFSRWRSSSTLGMLGQILVESYVDVHACATLAARLACVRPCVQSHWVLASLVTQIIPFVIIC